MSFSFNILNLVTFAFDLGFVNMLFTLFNFVIFLKKYEMSKK